MINKKCNSHNYIIKHNGPSCRVVYRSDTGFMGSNYARYGCTSSSFCRIVLCK